ncbi:MAG: bifunctional 4-hydroxy-2-oxoglutarate aldolase/2-dehydro-3-deoxy-phosphogluconate aldolase [Alphaproteobacteria bacterium]
MTTSIDYIAATAPVIPVLTITRIEDAVPLAKALVAGGLPVLEVTLRTSVALEAIAEISSQVADAMVGAGTVTRPDQIGQAREAGAQFAVSPGFDPILSTTATDAAMPYLPAVATGSEIMQAIRHGHEMLKFFPAESNGGCAALRAFGGPFSGIRFCPTGGIGAGNFQDYLALPNVVCVGGSWVAPASAISAGDWHKIETLARAASA